MWTLTTALEFIVRLETHLRPIGYACGLTGSVLTKGGSSHDLDVIIYPLSTATSGSRSYYGATFALQDMNLEQVFDRAFVQAQWRKKGSLDTKHVEVWRDQKNRRIDFFFLR